MILKFIDGMFVSLVKEVFKRIRCPKLDVNLYLDGIKRNPLRYSGEDGRIYDVGDGDILIYWEFVWYYKIVITNNSSIPVCRLKIKRHIPHKEMTITIAKEDTVIPPFESKTYDCIIRHCDTLTSREATRVMQQIAIAPYFIKNGINLTIQYTNEYKRKMILNYQSQNI